MARLGVALAALVALVACSYEPAPDAGDRKPFEDLIQAALIAETTSFMPDPPICPGPVSTDLRQRLLAELPSRLSPYFGPPQLEQELSIAAGVVQNGDGPACIYGGGVDWVRLDRLTVTEKNADATGQARLWSRIAQWQGRPVFAEPHNTIDVTFSFSKAGDHWLVNRYLWVFARGSEP